MLCATLALFSHGLDLFAFITASLISACCGMALMAIGGENITKEPLSRRDGYLVVTLGWVAFSIIGALPYIISGSIPSVTDAIFESVSGFTTTGITIIQDVEILPQTILFWRSLTQWIGGLGIVFFTIVILPIFGVSDIQLFAAEATGIKRGKLHPRISVSGRWILFVYIALTLACIVSLRLCGMPIFDSINHALSTTATGGFSIKNSGLSYYNSPSIENTIMLFMFLSGINYALIYSTIIKGEIEKLRIDTEFKWYLGIIVLFTLVIFVSLLITQPQPIGHTFRDALFHVVSIVTTTGYTTTSFNGWPPFVWLLLGLCMYLGGCGGSTSGGIKCIRIAVVLKTMRNDFYRMLHPNAIFSVKINNKSIGQSVRQSIFTFIIFLMAIIFIGWLFYIIIGIDITRAYSTSIACLSNIGLIIGEDGGAATWSSMPYVGRWFSAALMLMGRLEIFAVLIIFMPSFWKQR